MCVAFTGSIGARKADIDLNMCRMMADITAAGLCKSAWLCLRDSPKSASSVGTTEVAMTLTFQMEK